MNNIKNTISFQLINEEARELSWKIQNTIYVIKKGDSLFNCLSIEDGEILAIWKQGSSQQIEQNTFKK
jgi:hypothetical protein